MKKIIALVLALAMAFALVACGSSNGSVSNQNDNEYNATVSSGTESNQGGSESTGSGESGLKVGAILIGDENEGYTYAHMMGLAAAAEATGSQVIYKYTVPESEACYDAAVDLMEQGCTLIISNSYGHQSYIQQFAADYPEMNVYAATGDTAALSGLSNFGNAFTGIYQARYVSGVVAGMKIAELVADGKLTDANYDANGNVKVGYVGAYPYAEVVSGYTAFYLGIKSVVDNVVMDVQYTNSWFDLIAEGTAAEALISTGCVIIGQHADSTGAPSACQAAWEAGTGVYSVGYNIDMLAVAPDAALTSPTNDWAQFYTFAMENVIAGNGVVTDWTAGYEKDAVGITDLGPNCAEGTAEKVAEVVAALKSGELQVFDCSTFTVGGANPTSLLVDTDGDWTGDTEAVIDGVFQESYFRSAPSFDARIDGITELN